VSKNKKYQELAHRFIPAGAHTYSRADDGYPLNAPPILEKGNGAYVQDMDGNLYLDFGMALRAVTVGYANERIAEAAIREIKYGNNLTRASKVEVEAAELLCSLIPWVEMVKFAKNGSTVTSAAVKLARAFTGRDLVARCLDHPFFSYDDWFIGDTIMNSGVPESIKQLTINFRFNDIDSVRDLFAQHPGQIAALILEPATSEEPKNNFLQQLKDICQQNGALLILDEMITGFRWHIQGACKVYDVTPDLVTFGKGMANGFSVAALGGRRDIMELGGLFHDRERVFLISTTHGAEMSSLGAFIETMSVYQELDVVGHLWNAGKRLIEGFNSLAREEGISDHFSFHGVPCSPYFTTKDQEKEVSLSYRTLFLQEMLRGGVLMPWVAMAYAHQEDELDRTLTAGRKALRLYRRALESGIDGVLEGRAIKPVFRRFN
jgi:glutamate-1-semialdehyde 2,1-aminomutase